MKKISLALATLGVVLGLVVPAQAALIDRGGGLIYDTDLGITWLAHANYAGGRMSWDAAMTWASNLVYGGYSDWRLPSTPQLDPGCSNQINAVSGPPNPDTSYGFNCAGSEMGHLFYSELGGTAGASILTSGDPDLALFSNIQNDFYWSGTAYPHFSGTAWFFQFSDNPVPVNWNGYQFASNDDYMSYAWAVRDGDSSPAAVPEPSTMFLFGSALAGLAGFGRKRLLRRRS